MTLVHKTRDEHKTSEDIASLILPKPRSESSQSFRIDIIFNKYRNIIALIIAVSELCSAQYELEVALQCTFT